MTSGPPPFKGLKPETTPKEEKVSHPPPNPSPVTQKPTSVRVVFLESGSEIARFDIASTPLVLGTADDCDVCISDPSVSGHHAQLSLRDGTVYVEDLGSTNGTALNGQAVAGSQPLKSGDALQLGDWKVDLRVEPQPAHPPPAPKAAAPPTQTNRRPKRRLAILGVSAAIVVILAVVCAFVIAGPRKTLVLGCEETVLTRTLGKPKSVESKEDGGRSYTFLRVEMPPDRYEIIFADAADGRVTSLMYVFWPGDFNADRLEGLLRSNRGRGSWSPLGKQSYRLAAASHSDELVLLDAWLTPDGRQASLMKFPLKGDGACHLLDAVWIRLKGGYSLMRSATYEINTVTGTGADEMPSVNHANQLNKRPPPPFLSIARSGVDMFFTLRRIFELRPLDSDGAWQRYRFRAVDESGEEQDCEVQMDPDRNDKIWLLRMFRPKPFEDTEIDKALRLNAFGMEWGRDASRLNDTPMVDAYRRSDGGVIVAHIQSRDEAGEWSYSLNVGFREGNARVLSDIDRLCGSKGKVEDVSRRPGSRGAEGDPATDSTSSDVLWRSQQDCDAETAYTWFQRYQNGSAGVAQNKYEAGRWLRRAAEKGHMVAQCTVGVMLLESSVSTQADWSQGVSWLKKAAYQGDAKAQFLVALSYEEGKGVEKDVKKAEDWCRKAAAQGLKQAQDHLRARTR